MAKFEIWLEMNLRTIDGGAAVSKVTLEGPDGTTWGTWPRDFPDMNQSIVGIMGALREELPKGKHSAKLLAWAADGTQLSVFPLTLCGASDAATESANNRLIAERANALFISNAEKSQQGLMAIVTHTADVAQHLVEANKALTAELERSAKEREESRIRVLREEGKQQRLNELATRVMPLLELALGFLAERGATWLENKDKKAPEVPSSVGAETTALPPTKTAETTQAPAVELDLRDASGEQGKTVSDESTGAPDTRCDPQSRESETDGQRRPDSSRASLPRRNRITGSAAGKRERRKQ